MTLFPLLKKTIRYKDSDENVSPSTASKKKKVLRKESDKGCRNNSVSKMLALKTQGPECDPQNPWKKGGAAEKWLSR